MNGTETAVVCFASIIIAAAVLAWVLGGPWWR